ncbi:succinate dehydrogenase, hydrophobic membrane anchor protein [Devosia sp. J2-20]|jgi:succinate dehydrogenase / fumarate reductase, membrane anchor subunit|uniref:Succinate dehydrogenase hydrophobic membrane anchor subunit n=1 Tax=Devosia litorisediminis TaxID=2829817 RepID=A0A942EHU1_9HYPH|nr:MULTISPECIES: succinate dehydrogenase, hydrophobic membrane anchor protein [Devosia]MBS3850276.1 succinate dehydrogenase, hydrophobic membrane anchor protein [Devosia litorisediminis]WDR00031.1 succinate dehydrogenase, hydrophobic membrane anchor protein [Devosia sp. J2-20]
MTDRISDAVIADPKTKYGNAKASTRHFITQRVSGAINIVFVGFLAFIVLRLAGQDRPDMVATIGNAWIGLPLAALLVIVAIHMRNGMRDTLEDYFHGATYRLLMSLNTAFSLLIAVAGLAAILKLVFWG